MVPKAFAHYSAPHGAAPARLPCFMLSCFPRTADKALQPRSARVMRLERKDLFHLFNIKKNVVRAKQFNKYYSCRWQEEKGTSE